MSAFSTALLKAKSDPEARIAFYTLFLNTPFFIPTHAQVKTKSTEHSSPQSNKNIIPLSMELEGINYIFLFDSKEKLQAWAQKTIPFVCMPGHALVQMAAPSDTHWAVNLGTDHYKVFEPDEILWLQASTEQTH